MRSIASILASLLVAVSSPVFAQEEGGEDASPPLDLTWTEGPTTADIGGRAQIEIADGYSFLGPRDTRKLLEAMGNLTNDSQIGLVMSPDDEWFIVFSFDGMGYVKDDDRDDLDAAAMLSTMKEGTRASNEERRKRGYATLELVDWAIPPSYNPATNNLEWATKLKSEDGSLVVNHHTRLLGRRGVMNAALVTDPEDLEATLPVYRQVMQGYGFKDGERYAQFTQGDRIAEIGLAALVVGGAAAAATKLGFFAKIWKVLGKALIVVALGVAAFAKKIIGFFRRGGRGAGAETAGA